MLSSNPEVDDWKGVALHDRVSVPPWLSCVQDINIVWLTRAQTALRGIADHQVQLQEETAAQQQLSHAWQTFRDKVRPAVQAAQQTDMPAAAAAHAAAAPAAGMAAAPASLLSAPVSSAAGATDIQPGKLSGNELRASNGQALDEDGGEEEEEEEVGLEHRFFFVPMTGG